MTNPLGFNHEGFSKNQLRLTLRFDENKMVHLVDIDSGRELEYKSVTIKWSTSDVVIGTVELLPRNEKQEFIVWEPPTSRS